MRARRHDQDLLLDFEKLLDSRNEHRRGLEFEELLVRLFHRDGFAARRDPDIARPRQTDIYAKRFDAEFIVEAKWHGKPIDVSEVDGLRSRLKRVHPHVLGMVFSMSGFTGSAISNVEEERDRQILLFRDDEVYFLFAGTYNLVSLIASKRSQLTTDGRVVFRPDPISSWRSDTPDLPETEEFIEIEGQACRSYLAKTEFDEMIFVGLMPDVKAGDVIGSPFDLQVGLPISTSEELRNFLGWIHQRFGLSGEGRFSIQQSEASWFGVGAREFIEELTRQEARYREAKARSLHHSEEFAYFDEFQDGYLVVEGRSRVRARNREEDKESLYSVDLLVRMPGIPLDSRPYLELVEMAGHQNAYFVKSDEKVYVARLEEPIPVKPVARVISRSSEHEPLVAGLVIENPFYGNSDALRAEDHDLYSPFHQLSRSAKLVCMLKGRHGPDDVMSGYFLQAIRATRASDALIVQPICSSGSYVSITPSVKKPFREALAEIAAEGEAREKWKRHFEQKGTAKKARKKRR